MGEFEPDPSQNPYEGYQPTDWALEYIQQYGSIDGDHHKAWVIDQVARVLKGTPVKVVVARWGTLDAIVEEHYRFQTGEPTQAYHQWVAEARTGEDGPETYDYDVGIAP